MIINNVEDKEVYPEIIEFLKSTRTLVNQLQIISKLDMSETQLNLINNAAKTLLKKIDEYIKIGEKL